MQTMTVEDLEHWFIPTARIIFDRKQPLIRGGFGEVYKAALQGYLTPVAVKQLRPVGTKHERLRVAAVR